jgi:(p)ppGpp synthase/HD superfamily hydrolase
MLSILHGGEHKWEETAKKRYILFICTMEIFTSLRDKTCHKPSLDSECIDEACTFAEQAHQGQQRKSGEGFIVHPVSVAEIVCDLGGDTEGIVAALLHDTVEDTSVTIEDVQNTFGGRIAFLVQGLTKLKKEQVISSPSIDRKTESLRKWILYCQRDVRIAVLKIADRLHNMQTLGGHGDLEKRKSIAQETLDVYSPIAGKLGMDQIRAMLEHLARKHIVENSQTQSENTSEVILPQGITHFCFFPQEGNIFPSPFTDILLPLGPVAQMGKGNSHVFLHHLKKDILSETMAVQMDESLLFLPEGSTVLDSAFYQFGSGALYATHVFINDTEAHFYDPISHGDNVHFVFGKERTVQPLWLCYTHTALAQMEISKAMEENGYSYSSFPQ